MSGARSSTGIGTWNRTQTRATDSARVRPGGAVDATSGNGDLGEATRQRAAHDPEGVVELRRGEHVVAALEPAVTQVGDLRRAQTATPMASKISSTISSCTGVAAVAPRTITTSPRRATACAVGRPGRGRTRRAGGPHVDRGDTARRHHGAGGVPNTRVPSGTSRVTTAPAPTVAPRPTHTPGSTIAPVPTAKCRGIAYHEHVVSVGSRRVVARRRHVDAQEAPVPTRCRAPGARWSSTRLSSPT